MQLRSLLTIAFSISYLKKCIADAPCREHNISMEYEVSKKQQKYRDPLDVKHVLKKIFKSINFRNFRSNHHVGMLSG